MSHAKQKERPLDTYAEFALAVTKTYLLAVDLETGEIFSKVGSGRLLFNLDMDGIDDIGTFFEKAVHPADLYEVETSYRQIMQGKAETITVEFRTHPDTGDVRWIEIHAGVMQANEEKYLVGTLSEITDRKLHEQKLEQKNDQLEEFAGIISHDLRNPLNVAMSNVELARDTHESEYLDAIERACFQMETLLEDILASVRAGEPPIRGEHTSSDTNSVSLSTVAQRCWENVATEGARLAVETDKEIRVSEGRLQQLLENLFRNAVEHGGSDATVRVGRLEDESGFYVSDDGPGIPESDRGDIFETGYTTSEEGNGLGLYIVEKIIEDLSWDITVTDSQTGGARFEVSGIW